MVRLLAILGILIVAGCGSGSGTPCDIRGSGFTASHDCRHRCLVRTTIVCPDGDRQLPPVCSGAPSCTPGSCPSGEVCYSVDDPFEDQSYCIPEKICGAMDPQSQRAWEELTHNTAAQTRLEQMRRAQKRKDAMKPTHVPVDPQ